ERHAVALESPDAGQPQARRQPAGPRAHRQHDNVAFDRLAFRGDDSGRRAIPARDVRDDGDTQLRAAALSGVDSAAVKPAGVTSAGGWAGPGVAARTPEPSSQRGPATRCPPARAPFSRAAIMNVSMRR